MTTGSAADRSAQRADAGTTLNSVLLALLVGSSMFVGSEGGAAPVDLVLAAAAAHVLASIGAATHPREIGAAVARWMVASCFFVALAALSIIVFGGQVSRLVTDTVSFAYLIVPLVLLSALVGEPRMVRLSWVVAVASATFAAATLVQQDMRGTGFMTNPNMAAAWMGLALLFLGLGQTGLPPYVRWPVCAALAAALVATDSYSAAIGLALSAAYLLATHRHRLPAAAAVVAGGTLVLLFWDRLFRQVDAPDRLQSSSGSRSQIWSAAWETWLENPFGIGHGSFVKDQIVGSGIQVHNDYLTALVEQGVLGVLALAALGLAVFRSGYRMTRAMLIFVASSGFFHDVLNFRHIWIFIAFGIASDIHARRRAADAAVHAPEPSRSA